MITLSSSRDRVPRSRTPLRVIGDSFRSIVFIVVTITRLLPYRLLLPNKTDPSTFLIPGTNLAYSFQSSVTLFTFALRYFVRDRPTFIPLILLVASNFVENPTRSLLNFSLRRRNCRLVRYFSLLPTILLSSPSIVVSFPFDAYDTSTRQRRGPVSPPNPTYSINPTRFEYERIIRKSATRDVSSAYGTSCPQVAFKVNLGTYRANGDD